MLSRGWCASVQNRDSFQRQQTGLLHKQAGTRPLGTGTRQLVDPEALKAQATDVLAKAREQLDSLEARIELLLHACQRCSLSVPGVESVEFKHPLSPKGEQIVGYLTGVFGQDAVIAKAVQVGVFRYREAVAATDRLAAALDEDDLKPGLLEDLRLKMFYLTRYHADFKGDRVLAQLFPPPQTVLPTPSGAPGTQPISTAERLKQKQQREAVIHKAEILRGSLQPKVEILRATLEMLDNPRLNIGALFTPATRTARLIALGLGGNKELIDKVREAGRLYALLEEQLGEARAGKDVEPLKQTVYPLGRLAVDCQRHALLRELFPLGEQDLFPAESGAPDTQPPVGGGETAS